MWATLVVMILDKQFDALRSNTRQKATKATTLSWKSKYFVNFDKNMPNFELVTSNTDDQYT